MSLSPAGNARVTFSDLPEDEALKWANRMSEHSTPSFKEKLTYPGYNDAEVHYIFCEEDKVIPPEFQQAMIEVIKSSSGKDVKVHNIKSGHGPTHSQPDNLAKILKEIVQDA
jgi:predicted esterase